MATGINIEIKAAILLGLALLSYSVEGARRGLVDTSSTVFDVTSYGAKADGKTDNVEAFMKAWNAACHSNGTAPAKLVIPTGTFLAGQVSFEGPCKSPSPITVEIKGIIKAQTDVSEFPSPEWFSFEAVDGLIVEGGGSFDGQGVAVWKYNDCHQNSDCQLLPSSLKFSKISNAIIRGINSFNSKSFHFHLSNCHNITAHNLNISAPGNSPNTDGIHISRSNLVNISSSVIGTGDDCISIGQGATNISISGVTCGPGHGISVGSLGKYANEEDVKGIYVNNCTLSNTTNGVRIKTWPGSGPSQASTIIFEDIIMDGVKNPIIIDQFYGSHKAQPSRVKVSDVHYKNIRGTSTSDVAVSFLCSKLSPCEGVQLFDINLTYNGTKVSKDTPISATCSNIKAAFGGKQNPPPCKI